MLSRWHSHPQVSPCHVEQRPVVLLGQLDGEWIPMLRLVVSGRTRVPEEQIPRRPDSRVAPCGELCTGRVLSPPPSIDTFRQSQRAHHTLSDAGPRATTGPHAAEADFRRTNCYRFPGNQHGIGCVSQSPISDRVPPVMLSVRRAAFYSIKVVLSAPSQSASPPEFLLEPRKYFYLPGSSAGLVPHP